ncbi:MAG: glutamine synthetase family protein [Acidobacteriota bacterium]
MINFREEFESRGIRHVKLAGTDLDGVLRGKYVSPDKFHSAVEGNLGFCDVIFGWDSADALYDSVTFTGWHTGYPDLPARIDPATFRVVPWEPDTAFFLMDFYRRGPEGKDLPCLLSPRQLLQAVVDRAKAKGFLPVCSIEYEFFVFRETPESLREKGFQNLRPLSPGMFGYSVLRASQQSDLVHALLDQLRDFRVELEGFHTETGPGVYEAALRYSDAVEAADRAILFKTGVKEICARYGAIPTFMAKWNQSLPGSSGHVHQSLWDLNRTRNLFADRDQAHGMSECARHYVGGQLALMADWMPLIAPTINSYKRAVPGVWSPTKVCWGVDNRTAALRWIAPSDSATRVEYRLAAADGNPYLVTAAAIASGLWGIEHRMDPGVPITGDAYSKDLPLLPASLVDATRRFRTNETARQVFGDEFVDHYATTRTWEAQQFGRAVTDWELARYFEII